MRTRSSRRALSRAICSLVLAFAVLSPASTASSAPGEAALECGAGWKVVRSPNTSDRVNTLNGVAAIALDDAWAVGGHFARSTGTRTLIQHWDGTSWSIIPSPSVRRRPSVLNDVAASAPDDAWAVGDARHQPLIERWDGRSWTRVTAPGPGSLWGVVALGPRFALAVGYRRGAHETRPFALRWTGSAWEQVPAQGRGEPDPEFLASVSATGSNDAWAVGYGQGSEPAETMSQHWDGTSFAAVPTPNPGAGFDVLNAVTAVAPDDVWAVGQSAADSVHSSTTSLTEHWDGRSWTRVPSPNREFPEFDHFYSHVDGVDAVSSDEVWAVGATGAFHDKTPGGASRRRTLILKWNGGRWRLVSSPNAADIRNNELHDVSALPDGRVWAVGSSTNARASLERTLILARC
jgi:hypothetical protein